MIWPKWYSNQQLRTAYEQKFTYYGYDYRMSLIQIRQVRSGGKHLECIHYHLSASYKMKHILE